jgi:hypothetical protein
MAYDSNISGDFYAGKYLKVLGETVDASPQQLPLEDLSSIIGCLVFAGRCDDAQIIFQNLAGQISESKQVECRFFLGIGFCGNSSYQKASRLFAQNLRCVRQLNGHLERFFIYQGVAFFRYFCGQFLAAIANSSIAHDEAMRAGFVYGRVLALDLRGNAFIQSGQISLGLRNLDNAIELAGAIKSTDIQKMIAGFVIEAKAEFGLAPHTAIQDLEGLLVEYSKSASSGKIGVRLELARQLQLRGKILQANEVLAECACDIHALRHHRYEIILNLRYAMSHVYAGEFHLAMNLVRNAERIADKKVDLHLHLKILGLDKLVSKLLNLDFPHEREQLLRRLEIRTGCGMAGRISSRETASTSSAIMAVCDDPIGDLMDLIRNSPAIAAERLVRSGYAGVLQKLPGIGYGRRALVLNMIMDQLVVLSPNETFISEENISQSLRMVLTSLAEGEQDKQTIFNKAWDFGAYHPLKSDPLIYSAMSRLRRSLGANAHWIETTERGYRLADGVDVIEYSFQKSNPLPIKEIVSYPRPNPRLNDRQCRILEYLRENSSVDARTYRSQFDTSEITATRDLTDLFKLKLLHRMGKGRATRYALASKQEMRSPMKIASTVVSAWLVK